MNEILIDKELDNMIIDINQNCYRAQKNNSQKQIVESRKSEKISNEIQEMLEAFLFGFLVIFPFVLFLILIN